MSRLFARELATSDPDIVLGCWRTPPLPERLPSRLGYVCYITGSVKKMISRAHLEGGLIVTNWGGSISRTVAEAALFHILACLRNASHWAIAMHQPGVGAWKNGPNGCALPLLPQRRHPWLRSGRARTRRPAAALEVPGDRVRAGPHRGTRTRLPRGARGVA
jgi:hypothetical protein